MSKGSHRRPENAEAIRRNWPFDERSDATSTVAGWAWAKDPCACMSMVAYEDADGHARCYGCGVRRDG